ncbi:C40 family peptidase [Ornithinibacillus halophilus]|uniref:Cell wall-associated hydrolase, NlpC family n=1 Tax=Ornithinibacillus halophilus TaxID=930117 RepID=A0A1M5G4F0_9BACI|nr:C40 family peptidase [Ornithinibacillus halophilus]SHF98588.1 Cell wall-associated hydrolase, NlpC family [Ornithinibacillus halophilus]
MTHRSKLRKRVYFILLLLIVMMLLVACAENNKTFHDHKQIISKVQLKSDIPLKDAIVVKENNMLSIDSEAFINVSVASLWTEPDSNRPIDVPSTTNPVDMRKWSNSMSIKEKDWLIGELQTQALLGDVVTILEKRGDWARIAVHDQPTPKNELGYDAWLPLAQLIYHSGFEKLVNNNSKAVVNTPTAFLYNDRNMEDAYIEISYNTQLPVIEQLQNAVRVGTPGDGDKWLAIDNVKIYSTEEDIVMPSGNDLVQAGEQFLGLPYLWAGTSGFGFDCSGFTYSLYNNHGIIIPRDSSVQATHGTAVQKDELQKGDLLFFANENGKGFIHHVGMYIGNGKMIHAPNNTKPIEIINVFESSYWSSEYAGARRYID